MAFTDLAHWTLISGSAPWSVRCNHRSLVANGYVYLCGGYTTGNVKLNDVWRYDGSSWIQLTEHAEWSARSSHGFIYFLNKFWIVGGALQSGFCNDVWSSDDCTTWVREVEHIYGASPPYWIDRHEFALCEHAGYVYMSGGFDGSYQSDVQRTSDMVNWVPICSQIDDVSYGPREHGMIWFNNALRIYGGQFNTGVDNRQFSSVSGVSWTDHGSASWPIRKELQLLISDQNDELALIGGFDGSSYLNDVYTTTDGLTWITIQQVNSFTARADFNIVSYNGNVLLLGGINDSGLLNDIWSCRLQVIPDGKIINNPIIGFKIETTPFVAETLTASDYKYSVNSDIKVGIDIGNYNQDIASGDFSNFPSISGKRMCVLDFSIYLYSKSTLTTAPTYYDILQACGWKQVDITNGLAILPDSSKNRVPATIEVSFPEEGILPRQLVYKISGAMGTVKLNGELPIVKLEFSFMGRLESITTRGADSIITPITFDTEIPVPVLQGTFTLLGEVLPLQSFTIDSGEEVILFSNSQSATGYDGARITDRISFGEIDVFNGAELPADLMPYIEN